MIDEKGKLFGKLSIIDALVLLVIVIAIIGCGYKFLGNNDAVVVTNNDKFTTVIRLEGAKDYVVDAVKEGEVVYEQHGGELGTITAVKVEPYLMQVGSGTKDVEYLVNEDRKTIYLTLDCKGTVNKKGFYSAGNAQIFAGATISVQSRLFMRKDASIEAVYE